MTRKAKVVLILIPIGLLLLGGMVQGIQFWWRHGFSRGERTGVIRKMSVKGPPVGKYLAGEMVVQGSLPGLSGEVWEFSVDDRSDDNPIVKALNEAERSGARVTLKYRQDHPLMWWSVNPIEYRITEVVK
jgi:hypothetical protein